MGKSLKRPKNALSELWRQHDQLTASFRADLATRSAAEKLYDDCVLSHMAAGDSVPSALAKANAVYPTEALVVNAESIADMEAHYDYLSRLKTMDRIRLGIETLQAREQQQIRG